MGAEEKGVRRGEPTIRDKDPCRNPLLPPYRLNKGKGTKSQVSGVGMGGAAAMHPPFHQKLPVP